MHCTYNTICILKGRLYTVVSRNCNRKQFTLLQHDVYLTPNEVFEPFVEVNEVLSIENDMYLRFVEQAK